jgi:hypothetical protein
VEALEDNMLVLQEETLDQDRVVDQVDTIQTK